MLAAERLQRYVADLWNAEIVPTLVDYIRIPNKSPHFDPKWQEHGYMNEAVALFETWARSKLTRPAGRCAQGRAVGQAHAVILLDIPGEGPDTVLLYRPPRQAAGDDRLGRSLGP